MDNSSAFEGEVGGDGAVPERLDDQTSADSIKLKFDIVRSFAAAAVVVVVVVVACAGAGRSGGSSGGVKPEVLEVNVDAEDLPGVDGVSSSQGEGGETRAGTDVCHAWGRGGGREGERGRWRGGGNSDGGGEGDFFDSELGELA